MTQIIFFKKSWIDLDQSGTSITVTDAVATNTGSAYTSHMTNRNNRSGWMTTGSTDAANTELLIELGENRAITDILLIGHNLKAYTIQYWDGSIYTDFSTAISETTNTEDNTDYNFTSVSSSKIKLIITGCMTADDDKKITQLIISDRLGQLSAYPIIKSPRLSQNRKRLKMLSGKSFVVETVGDFSSKLSVKNWNTDADLSLLENIYFDSQSVLMWPCGGDETQFSHVRQGYRKEDIYLIRPADEWNPEWYDGLYKTGMRISVNFVEVIS